MKIQKKAVAGCIAASFMFLLIMETKTALEGAAEGIEICLKTVIPSLFPFFFLSGIINSSLLGCSGKLLKPIGRMCGIPSGAEPLFLLGMTGGYPVGAQAINAAYEAGSICKEDAQRMLGYCCNAGPAFIFGIAGALFEDKLAPWAIWAILIVSSVITGILLPEKSKNICIISSQNNIRPLEQALKAMASVCGWVIIFRVLLAYLTRWCLWLFPAEISVLITGALELTNGCIALYHTISPAFRFTALTAMLSFGGLCVGLQTVSVTGKLSCKTYFLGKFLQTVISIPLAIITYEFLH